MKFNFFECIPELIKTLGWQGDKKTIIEAAPYYEKELTIDGLRNVLANIGFASKSRPIKNRFIQPEWLPCLVIEEEKGFQQVYLITNIDYIEGHFTSYNFNTKEWSITPISSLNGMVIYFYDPAIDEDPSKNKTWIKELFRRFKPSLMRLYLFGFLSTILTLTSPIFIYAVYDFIIPSSSNNSLAYFLIGMFVILSIYHLLNLIKSKMISYLGARLDVVISTSTIQQILSLPPPLVEGASVPEQLIKIREFEQIRSAFTGILSQLMLEIPFTIIFLIVLGIFSGAIVFIPLALILIIVALFFFYWDEIKTKTENISRENNKKRSFLIETLKKILTIKDSGTENIWVQRFQTHTAQIGKAQYRYEMKSNLPTHLIHVLIKLAGSFSIMWAGYRVIEGDLTYGGMIVVILIVWRCVAPIHSAFTNLMHIDTILSTFRQINTLMNLPKEDTFSKKDSGYAYSKNIHSVHVNNLFFKYIRQVNPALQGVTMEAKEGEMVAIIGNNGSGKSTLIKLLLSFYKAQAGHILFNGVENGQYSPSLLRESISYHPEYAKVFHGSITDNIRIVHPEATMKEIEEACIKAGVLGDILNLNEKFDTFLTDKIVSQFSSGFMQKISLARTYIKPCSLMLFDEPTNNLDDKGDILFKETIASFKGSRTIIIATHRPSIFKMADKILALHDGKMLAFGKNTNVLSYLEKREKK